MPRTEVFPRIINFAFVAHEDTSILFTKLKSLSPKILSSHSTDIIRGDGHRWHYAYSFSFLAKTGWSPILRNLLGLKRRSNRSLEKGEDGARAQMIEEYLIMIARRTLIGIETDSLLDEFVAATRTLEVRNIDRCLWEQAILAGAELFDFLRSSNGGCVSIDLDRGTISWHHRAKAPSPDNLIDKSREGHFVPFRRATGVYSLLIVETKLETVEIFAETDSGGLLNLASKAEEWSTQPQDNFRWHDLFHLSFFAICGWSAVCKTMLGLSDEVQPKSGVLGMRGAIIEEAIIARFYTETSSGIAAPEAAKIASLAATKICNGTKLSAISASAWEEALLTGHSLVSEAVAFGGGLLSIDLGSKRINFTRK